MPNYVTITPKYQVIDLADMLKVPEMLNKERQEQEDKYNENLDKLAAIEAMADESTRYRLQNYRNSLENAANTLIGRQGTLADAAAYMNQARQYYRDALPIIKAYETKQKEIDTRRQILANDPSARFTALPDLETYIKNPNQDWYHYSGDKVYDKAMKSAAVISKDKIIAKGLKSAGRAGFVKEINDIGYTPEEQVEYARLIGLYNRDHSDAKALKGLNDPKYKQLFEDYKGLLQDNLSHNYSTEDRDWGKQRILDGQLVGMQRQTTEAYHTDPLAVASARSSRSSKKSSGNGTEQNPFLQQSITAPGVGEKSGVKSSTQDKMLATPTLYRNTETGVTTPSIPNPKLYPWINQNATYKPVGKYQASAEYYNRKPVATISDKDMNVTISGITSKLIKNADIGQRAMIKGTNPGRLKRLAKKVGLDRYKDFEDIPQNILDKFYSELKRYGNVDYHAADPNNSLARMGFYKIYNEVPNLPQKPGLFSKKEFEELQKKGLQFYNPDGTLRTEKDIEWDAWDLVDHQSTDVILTTKEGAGKRYTAAKLEDVPLGDYKDLATGKTITLKRIEKDGDKAGFSGYNKEKFGLNPYSLLRKEGAKKRLKLSDGVHNFTIEVPLDDREKEVINTRVNIIKGNLANELYLAGRLTFGEAMNLSSMPVNDFIKSVDMERIPGINIEELMDELDDSILKDYEINRVPANSETNSKAYSWYEGNDETEEEGLEEEYING